MRNIVDYAALGERVRRFRREQHLTQEQLAERVGISASFLGHIERGERVLSMETFIGLCCGLSITPNELLGMEIAPAENEIQAAQARELLQAALDILHRARSS